MGRSKRLKSRPRPESPRSFSASSASPSEVPFPTGPPRYYQNYEPAPPPEQLSSSSGHDHNILHKSRKSSSETAAAYGVANGSVGGNYGPYNYVYKPSSSESRFTSRMGSAASPQGTSTAYEEPVTYRPPLPPRENKPRHKKRADPDESEDSEMDDALHNPDPVKDALLDRKWSLFSARGWMNIGAVILILLSLIFLFGGYPIFAYVNRTLIPGDGFNLGGINNTGQIPDLINMPRLVDEDTPLEAYERKGHDGHDYQLVFSDEFNRPGRTFFEGDDPYWEAVDLHYWLTGNLEWYSPEAVTTEDGKLVITMTEERIHDLGFKSGMVQTWNKFCFTNGYIEVSASLPGSSRAAGLWPAAWTIGNLGRAGYGATTEGTWPFSYDSCDIGTFPNQTRRDGTPQLAMTSGAGGRQLSVLPGQKLSACTCPGSDHPGPNHFNGRSAPEIDIFETVVNTSIWQGEASQSMQAAPFNAYYQSYDRPPAAVIYNQSRTFLNSYKGGIYQQAISAHSNIGTTAYAGQAFQTYAFEYWARSDQRDAGFVTWFVNDTETWTLNAEVLRADRRTEIDRRLVPEEPMSIILNLAIAPSFERPDFKHLRFPAKLYIDYVRVYQRVGEENVGCDPKSHPTEKYIKDHITAYTNANLTTWAQAGYTFPRNSLYDGC